MHKASWQALTPSLTQANAHVNFNFHCISAPNGQCPNAFVSNFVGASLRVDEKEENGTHHHRHGRHRHHCLTMILGGSEPLPGWFGALAVKIEVKMGICQKHKDPKT